LTISLLIPFAIDQEIGAVWGTRMSCLAGLRDFR
jgi:hypothetical protein